MSLIALLGAAVVSGWALSGDPVQGLSQTAHPAAEPKTPEAKQQLQIFMRKKLTASNAILEGLCTDDLALVAQGARELNQMSNAEKWRVRNDVLYKQFSGEFQKATGDLVKAAEEKNEDRALLKWMDATMSCVECHRFVRSLLITKD